MKKAHRSGRRDPERIDRILEKLGRLWREQPDARLGQLVFNLSWQANPRGDVFYAEDSAIEEEIDRRLPPAGTRPRQARPCAGR